MKRLAVASVMALVAVCACKPKEVPYQPPPKEDAPPRVIDAPPAIDASEARAAAKVTKIVVGDHASCALLEDETLRCWGKNSEGQLGNGTTADSATPVMPALRGVKDIVMGSAHACALLDDQSVTCWGQINFGKRENLLAPTAVPGLAKVKRLFAVKTASCATTDDESLVCWGDVDHKGHLKLSGSAVERRVPTPARGLSRVLAVTANGALAADGTVWFWAADGEPVRTAMADVVEVASTGDEICGLRRDGKVACAGPATRCADAAPKPAKAAKTTKKAPARTAKKRTAKPVKGKQVAARPAPRAALAQLPIEVLRLPAAKHLAFDVGLCVVTTTDKLQCLAPNNACTVDSPWPGLANVDYVTGNCARLEDGSARCWSVDTKSRLVRAIADVRGALSLAASSSHACVVLADRSVACWGSNKHGALGRGKSDETSPAQASAVTL